MTRGASLSRASRPLDAAPRLPAAASPLSGALRFLPAKPAPRLWYNLLCCRKVCKPPSLLSRHISRFRGPATCWHSGSRLCIQRVFSASAVCQCQERLVAPAQGEGQDAGRGADHHQQRHRQAPEPAAGQAALQHARGGRRQGKTPCTTPWEPSVLMTFEDNCGITEGVCRWQHVLIIGLTLKVLVNS